MTMIHKYKISLHVHTKYSPDSLLPFRLLYWQCQRQQIDCIAITDHNTAEGALAFQAYCAQKASREYCLQVIVGEEIMTTGGEIIGLYLTDSIPSGMTPEATIKAIKSQGGIVYIPHPYEEKRRRSVLKEQYIASNQSQIDCMECHNGRNTKRSHSAKQAQLVAKYGLLPVIGEDAHTVWELGRNTMGIEELPSDKASFIRCMQTAEFGQPRYAGAIHHLTKIDRILKFVLRGDFRGLYRFIHDRIVQNLPKMV